MIEVRRHAAEVRGPAGNTEIFDHDYMTDARGMTLAEVEEFCRTIRALGSRDDQVVAVSRAGLWALVPHPDATQETAQRPALVLH